MGQFYIAVNTTPEGLTLHDYVNMTAQLFVEVVATYDRWEESLYSTGYAADNDYENRHWKLYESTSYEIKKGFPRIEVPLAYGIDMVKYSLSLDACVDFEINSDLINIIKEGVQSD